MARSAAELAGKLGALATTVDRGRTEAVAESALLTKTVMLAGPAKSGLSPSSRLGGRKWGVGYSLRPGSALVAYRGPVHWVESGTDPHVIGARKLGTRKGIQKRAGSGQFGSFGARRGARALSIPGIGPRAWARHPGTSARPFWSDTKKQVQKVVPEEMRRQLRRQIRKAGFGVLSG